MNRSNSLRRGTRRTALRDGARAPGVREADGQRGSHHMTKRLKPYSVIRDSGVTWLGRVPAHRSCARIRLASASPGWPACSVSPRACTTRGGVVPFRLGRNPLPSSRLACRRSTAVTDGRMVHFGSTPNWRKLAQQRAASASRGSCGPWPHRGEPAPPASRTCGTPLDLSCRPVAQRPPSMLSLLTSGSGWGCAGAPSAPVSPVYVGGSHAGRSIVE